MSFWPTPGDLKEPACAKHDVAAVAARLLLDPSWSGVDSIPMIGPEDISFDETTAIISDVIGKPVQYHLMSMDDLKAMMIKQGASEGMAQAMVNMMTAKNEGWIIWWRERHLRPLRYADHLPPVVRGHPQAHRLAEPCLTPVPRPAFGPSKRRPCWRGSAQRRRDQHLQLNRTETCTRRLRSLKRLGYRKVRCRAAEAEETTGASRHERHSGVR
ncbi:hypothetical protein ABID21_004808 [Pseudorhizobium tarimense]|uniref:Uncharacterized protein n=1 Tax=Pseudorhizobium tarimense TaxID=1079109 RepID=A0ABV2HDP2_9HYPH